MAGTDELSRLLQERFASHEVPAPEGVWENIAGQLAAAQEQGLSELLQDRFAGHEADVDPGVWEAISQQIGHTAVGGAAAGTSVWTWVAAGLGAAAVVGGVFWMAEPSTPAPVAPETVERVTLKEDDTQEVTSSVAAPFTGSPASTNTQQVASSSPGLADKGASTKGQAAPDGTEDVRTPPAIEGSPEPAPPTTDLAQPEGEQVVARLVGEMTREVEKRPVVAQDPHDPKVVENTQEDPEVLPDPAITASPELQIYLPNVFTPNGDGVNDSYEPQGGGMERVKIRVYSLLNNELVFFSEGLKPWNGNDLSGTPCPAGHYIYAIEVIGADERVHSKGQTVLLIR
ncbi:MAG: gliding motility-associated C-terminal domain-containing protein [Flavobacteriales bacterium]|nr:gliding motility-associated C-terminal domain-containing protein [Flavobacteriales bacterium]